MREDESSQHESKEYWETLLEQKFDLRKVGYPSLSSAFNVCLYRAMINSVSRVLKPLCLPRDVLSKALILDVGCGIGFWIDYWLRQGGQRIVGMDITTVSVSRLAFKYPNLRFVRADISDTTLNGTIGSFDIISAMSVLHHIPLQKRWEQALRNLCHMMKYNGLLLIMDPILKYEWCANPFMLSTTGRARTIVEHISILKENGVRVEALVPTVSIVGNPVDAKWDLEFKLLEKWWSLFSRIARRELLMRSVWWPVYLLDRFLCRINYMPSSKIMLCRKDTIE